MRADAHYVEQLDARTPTMTVQYVAVHAIDCGDSRPVEPSSALVESIKRHGVLEPLVLQRSGGAYRTLSGARRLAAARAAGLRDVPCLVHHVGDEHARTLREALTRTPPAPPTSSHATTFDSSLTESLATLGSCAALLKSATPLTRSVAIDLVQAEARRATYLLQASHVLRHGADRSTARIVVPEMLSRIMEAVEPERRLRRIAIDADLDGAQNIELRADQQLLVGAIALVMLTMMMLLEGMDGAAIAVSVNTVDRSRLAITIGQDRVAIGEDMDAHAEAIVSSPASASRAVVPLPALAVVALRRVAQLYDGKVRTARSGSGAQVTIELPVSRL